MTLTEVMDGLGFHDHCAPIRPYTAERAHEAMRLHVDCSAESCPAKHAAFAALVEHGELQPGWDHDPRRRR